MYYFLPRGFSYCNFYDAHRSYELYYLKIQVLSNSKILSLNTKIFRSKRVLLQIPVVIDTITDFQIKLGMAPCKHLVEISIFSINNVTVRPTKIINGVNKNWAYLQKKKYFKNQNFQKKKVFYIKVGLLIQYSSQNFWQRKDFTNFQN